MKPPDGREGESMVLGDRCRGLGVIALTQVLVIILFLVSNRNPLGPWSHLIPSDAPAKPSRRTLPLPALSVPIVEGEDRLDKGFAPVRLECLPQAGVAPARPPSRNVANLAHLTLPAYLQLFRREGTHNQLSPPAFGACGVRPQA